MSNKSLLKYIIRDLLASAGKIILALGVFLGVIWIVGWILETLDNIPMCASLVILFVLCGKALFSGK